MNILDDIKSPLLLWLKAGLFGLLAIVAAVTLIVADNRWSKVVLLAICIWAACRLYYFFFYVLDHYVGGDKNASLFAMLVKGFRKPGTSAAPTQPVVDLPLEKNLFGSLPHHLPEELTETLVLARHVRIERIVSTGQAGPDGFWYDQPEHEWVAVLQGEAVLEFENHSRRLSPGDHVLIPPRQKHRVASTSDQEPTVWLAVFY